MPNPLGFIYGFLLVSNTIGEDSHIIILSQYWPAAPELIGKVNLQRLRLGPWLSRRFKRIMETAEKENNIVWAGWMARGKHGWNNTIDSRLLIKGGNLAKLVPARRAASANPDMSTSDLHHSSPQARINRPLTPCKRLPLKTNRDLAGRGTVFE